MRVILDRHSLRRAITLTVSAFCMVGVCLLMHPLATVSTTSADTPNETDGVHLPIIMYHSILKSGKSLGKYVISEAEFEDDLRYLTQNGYTTVVMQDVIDYVKQNKPLPEKPIMLTFDDGYYNNYVYAYPLLQKYHCRMVLSPIGRWTEAYSEQPDMHVNYSHVTWTQLQEMKNSGLVEIQNHSYNMHSTDSGRKGSKKKAVESIAEYQAVFSEDVSKMQELFKQHLDGYAPSTFTYPFGAISREALPILQQLGFEAALTCESRINLLSHDADDLYKLGRYLRPHGVSAKAFFQKIL